SGGPNGSNYVGSEWVCEKTGGSGTAPEPRSNFESVKVYPKTSVTCTVHNIEPRTNPDIHQCGLNFALVYDLSSSLSSDDVDNAKTAGTAFVNALEGTPSKVGVYSFGTNAPAGNNNNHGPQSISSSAGATMVNGWISGLHKPSKQG